MRDGTILSALVVFLGGLGTWLLLPHRFGAYTPRRVHVAGAALVLIGTAALLLVLAPPGPVLPSLFFYLFALAALLGGVLMIASRNPVHGALWFAVVVLATTGLFLLAGAQFLAAGTVIVYAGAIIVTFLFVIMLAQAGGQAFYDRTARAPARATLCCFLLLWALLYGLLAVRQPRPADRSDRTGIAAARLVPLGRLPSRFGGEPGRRVAAIINQSVRPTARMRPALSARPIQGVPRPHMASLGGTLFTDHLIAVEVAGVLLFVALIAAAAIATPRAPVRPPSRR